MRLIQLFAAMQFELTREYIENLKDAIAEGRDRFLTRELSELHPADIAEIFDQLKAADTHYIFRLIPGEKAADVLIELEEDVREKLLATLTSQEIADQVITNIDSDDAADVINELPQNKQIEVIAHLTDLEQAQDIRDLLKYDEDSAGGLMAKELVKVRSTWTIARSIREMRKQAEDIDEVYTIYVVDDEERLIGTLSLKKLLFSSSSIKSLISDIYTDNQPHYIYADAEEEEVANIMDKYDLIELPVVDLDMKLLGRITIDDVVDFIKEEAEKDYQLASGISERVETSDKSLIMVRARLPWLIIGLVGGVLIAQVIGIFEAQLEQVGALMLFIPLIAAMAGNVGVQSSAIVVQGLASNNFEAGTIFSRLLKELWVAVINGLICGTLILVYNLIFSDSLALSYTVGISLFTVIIFASLFGTIIPLFLNKIKIDPALATGPFITTANDLIGLTIYFSFAKMFFHL